MIPCASASEQRNILDSLKAETNAMVVAPGYLRDALELAHGDGLAHGLPPVEIAELCGLTGVRPQNQTTSELLITLGPDDDLASCSKPENTGLTTIRLSPIAGSRTATLRLPAPCLQCYLELLLHRYNATIKELADPKGLNRMFRRINNTGQHDWCVGFLEGKQNFKTSWSARFLGANDKAMLRQIEAMATDPAATVSTIPALSAWLTGRLDAVNR